MASKSLIEKREMLQNWIDEGARLATEAKTPYLVKVKISKEEPGRPGEGAWRVIHSSRDIPSGCRFSVKRSIDEKVCFVLLEADQQENTQESVDNQTEVVENGAAITGNGDFQRLNQLAAQIDERYERSMRGGLMLLAGIDKLTEVSRKNQELLNLANESQEKAMHAMSIANAENSKSTLFKNLGFASNRLMDMLQIVISKDDSKTKSEVAKFLELKSILKRNDIDIDSLVPSDIAIILQIKNDPSWAPIIEQYKREELEKNINSATSMDEQGEE